MFAFQQIASQSRRFVLGFAVAALAVTTLAAPAGTAQAARLDPSDDLQVSTAGNADLEVTPVYRRSVGNAVVYSFKIKNNGPSSAPHIAGYREVRAAPINGSGYMVLESGYFPLSLNSGASVNVTYTCKPPVGYKCDQTQVLAFMNDQTDPNMNNNLAVQ